MPHGFTWGLVLLKDLSKTSNTVYLYDEKSFLNNIGKFTGPMPHGFTLGLMLLKNLSKTSNTEWYFHAQIKVKRWTIITTTL